MCHRAARALPARTACLQVLQPPNQTPPGTRISAGPGNTAQINPSPAQRHGSFDSSNRTEVPADTDRQRGGRSVGIIPPLQVRH